MAFTAAGCKSDQTTSDKSSSDKPITSSDSSSSDSESTSSADRVKDTVIKKEDWVAVSDDDTDGNSASTPAASSRTIELVIDDHPGVPGFNTYYNYKIYVDGRIVNKKEYNLTCNVPEVSFKDAQIVVPAAVKEKYNSISVTASIVGDSLARDSYVITFPRWEATLIDEFEGNSLNSDIWALRPSWPADKVRRSNPNNIIVKDGILTLQGTAEPWEGAPYSDCFIHTKDKFTQTYGMFTASVQVPKEGASITAFWLLPNRGDWGSSYLYRNKGADSWIGEVDLLEFSPGWNNNYQATMHSWRGDGSRGGEGTLKRYFDSKITEGFHEYTAVWTENGFYCYYDGILTLSQVGIEATDNPAYIILDLELGKPENVDIKHWAGEFKLSELPIQAKFDYVKVYKQKK